MLSFLFCLAQFLGAEIVEFPGGKRLPHDKYIHVVPERVSPVERLYIKSKDGLYVAAALRKPQGAGPFPVLIHFHGAPGGRGMDQLVGWARGDHGSPVFERLLQEGFVIVIADYRGGPRQDASDPNRISYADDAQAVVAHVRTLPYVDPQRISVYGVSLGGDVVMHLLSREKLHSAILGAPAPISFLGAQPKTNVPPEERWRGLAIDDAKVGPRIAAIQTPILLLVGTADGLIHLDRILHDALVKANKSIRMEIYANGYHDFVMGPQGHPGRDEPLMDITLAAMESTIRVLRKQ